MFDKFQQNCFTIQITEAVMAKRGKLKTFCAFVPVITQEHEDFGVNKDIGDN